jgi:hypothetical protein
MTAFDEAPRPLAVCRSYADLHAAMRARSTELRLTRAEMDERVGLAGGHASKLLAPKPTRRFGPKTFGPILAFFGVALVVVEDDESLARLEQILAEQKYATDNAPASQHWRQQRGSAWARRMNALRTMKLTAEQRRQSAVHAARARWGERSNGSK